MSRYLSIALMASLLLPQVAVASPPKVLTAENRTQLCTSTYQGKPAVDKDVLALEIVTTAGGGPYLDGSNSLGFHDGAIQLRTGNGIQSEPVYVILNNGAKTEPCDNKPFGPNINLRTDKRACLIQNGIAEIMREELIFLTTNNSIPAGPDLTYRILRREKVIGAPTKENEWANPELLFRDDPPLVIVCESKNETSSPSVAAAENPQNPSVGTSILKKFRLRGTAKDLTIKSEDLASANAATISYQRDGEAKTDTFGLKGVIGLDLPYKDGAFDTIPFISYEKHSVTGGKADIEKLQLGLLFGYKIENSKYAIHTKLEPSLIQDLKCDSRQGKLRVYVDPAFALGSGQGVLFGSYLRPFSPLQLQLRPELTLIGDVSHIFDTGTNPALTAASEYFGLGGELSLSARLNLGQPISDFVFNVGVRYLPLFGNINKQEARRWFSTLGYSPKNSPFGISLKFSKGENDDTFQQEEIYSLNFTVRY